MQYLTGMLTALAFSVFAYLVVLIIMNLSIRGLNKSTARFPVLPKYSADNPDPLTGLDFEQFVVERFDPGHFRIMKWSRKYTPDEPGAETDQFPDLEYQALVHKQIIPFAIECEWKPAFTRDAIDLSGFRLIPGYRRPGSEKEMPVFLILGIGGTQCEPEECYILPVAVIRPAFTFLSKEFLTPFRRQKPDSVLFLDTNQMTLR